MRNKLPHVRAASDMRDYSMSGEDREARDETDVAGEKTTGERQNR
jgi:hypothetical protein